MARGRRGKGFTLGHGPWPLIVPGLQPAWQIAEPWHRNLAASHASLTTTSGAHRYGCGGGRLAHPRSPAPSAASAAPAQGVWDRGPASIHGEMTIMLDAHFSRYGHATPQQPANGLPCLPLSTTAVVVVVVAAAAGASGGHPYGAFRCNCFVAFGIDCNAMPSRRRGKRAQMRFLLEPDAQISKHDTQQPRVCKPLHKPCPTASRTSAPETCCDSCEICVTLPVCDRDMGPGLTTKL
jgi:hypothetical protein